MLIPLPGCRHWNSLSLLVATSSSKLSFVCSLSLRRHTESPRNCVGLKVAINSRPWLWLCWRCLQAIAEIELEFGSRPLSLLSVSQTLLYVQREFGVRAEAVCSLFYQLNYDAVCSYRTTEFACVVVAAVAFLQSWLLILCLKSEGTTGVADAGLARERRCICMKFE